jgi:hypothetical protein
LVPPNDFKPAAIERTKTPKKKKILCALSLLYYVWIPSEIPRPDGQLKLHKKKRQRDTQQQAAPCR